MGSKDSDEDPMNLGPFMATYVMGSPFGGLQLERDPSPEPLPLPPIKRVPTVTIPPPPPPPAARPPLPPPPVLTPRPLPKDDSGPGNNNRCHSNKVEDPPEKETSPDNTDSDDFVIVEDGKGMVVDTPKAHVGSNASFAKSLKNCTVPDGHLMVQQWLWQLYRFIPGYAADTSMDTLLKEVQTLFPHISRTALCRILQFTYPNCPKKRVISKSNLFFFGLVRRPTDEYYKDEAVQSRVMAHKSGLIHSGGDVSDDVKEKTVSILCWEGHLDCFPSFSQIPKQPLEVVAKMTAKRDDVKSNTRSPNQEPVPVDYSTSTDGAIADRVGRRTSARQSQRKRQNVKRLFDNVDKMLEDVMSEVDEDEEEEEDSVSNCDSDLGFLSRFPRHPTEVGVHRVAKRQVPVHENLQPSKRLRVVNEATDDGDVSGGAAEPMWSEIRSLIRGHKSGEELWKHVESIFASHEDSSCVKTEAPSPPGNNNIARTDTGEVTVKEEPVDPGYGDFQNRVRSPTCSSSHSSPTLCSSSLLQSQSSSNRSSHVDRLQDALAKARGLIETQQGHLDKQTRQTEDLRKQLQTKNKSLQDRDAELHQLGTRFFCLATQFYCLNGEIQKFAGLFQTAINKSAQNAPK